MRKSLLIGVVLCFAVVAPAKAQLFNDYEELQEQVQQKLDKFYSNLQCLAGRDNVSHDTKMEIYDQTLKFFIGEGKSYMTIVPNPYGGFSERTNPPVTMSIINSKYNKMRTKQPMATYLTNLIKRSEDPNYRYKQVVIEGADVVRIDNFSRVGDGRYMTTAHILQYYMGYGKDGTHILYEDYTAKTITIYIDKEEDGSFPILFGDMDCDDKW